MTTYQPIITSQSDLADAWTHLMGPWGFGGPSIWLMLIVDDRPVPQLVEIAEAEEPPSPEQVGGFEQMLRMLAEDTGEGTRLAFLRSRPGPDRVTDLDRAWARMLHESAESAGVACEVVHLATKGAVRALSADEIGLRKPA